MIEYIIKINYILSYQRYKKLKRFSPEDSCLIFTDLEMGNIGLLSIYFAVIIFGNLGILNKVSMYIYGAVLISFYFWAHFKIEKRILKSPIRKTIKKLSEEEKKRYSRLAVIYFIASTFLWILAFTWREILHRIFPMILS